jgi:cytochrome P450
MSSLPLTRGPLPNDKRKYNYPPGLKHNLLFYMLNRFRPGDPITFFQHLADTYGAITHYRLGPEHIVFINDPDLIKEILVNQHQNFTKERTQQRMKILMGEGLITSEGKYHLKQRHLAQPAFHRQRIAGYAVTMVERAMKTRDSWTEYQHKGIAFDVAQEMMHLTLSIVGKTLFGSDVESEVTEIAGEVNAVMRLYNFLIALPKAEYLLDYPIPGLRRFRRARARLDDTVYRMIDEHRRAKEDNGDLLSMLLAAKYEDGSSMTDEQLRDEVLTMFLAGYETAANALTWTWYLLSQNPEAEHKLQAEINQVLDGRAPGFDDLARLRYAEMVLAESMRLYPPAWAMGRQAVKAFELGPYYFPAGTSVFMSQYIMHRNESYFPDPLRFDPERFTPEAKAARPRFSYFPFGGGTRQCIGESFAWMELVLLLTTIAQKWRLRLVPGHPIKPQPLVTLRSRYGMQMTIEPA